MENRPGGRLQLASPAARSTPYTPRGAERIVMARKCRRGIFSTPLQHGGSCAHTLVAECVLDQASLHPLRRCLGFPVVRHAARHR